MGWLGRGKRKHALGGKDAEEGRRTTDGRKGIHAPSHKHRMPNYEEALHSHTPAAAIPGIPKAGTPLSDPLLGQKQGFQQFRTMFSCRVRGRPVFSQIFVCYPPWGPSDPLVCHPQSANRQPRFSKGVGNRVGDGDTRFPHIGHRRRFRGGCFKSNGPPSTGIGNRDLPADVPSSTTSHSMSSDQALGCFEQTNTYRTACPR